MFPRVTSITPSQHEDINTRQPKLSTYKFLYLSPLLFLIIIIIIFRLIKPYITSVNEEASANS